jgi:hypothetical protein
LINPRFVREIFYDGFEMGKIFIECVFHQLQDFNCHGKGLRRSRQVCRSPKQIEADV